MSDDVIIVTARIARAKNVILAVLLPLTPDDRREALYEVHEIICQHCGYGNLTHPNGDCQCWNDE